MTDNDEKKHVLSATLPLYIDRKVQSVYGGKMSFTDIAYMCGEEFADFLVENNFEPPVKSSRKRMITFRPHTARAILEKLGIDQTNINFSRFLADAIFFRLVKEMLDAAPAEKAKEKEVKNEQSRTGQPDCKPNRHV